MYDALEGMAEQELLCVVGMSDVCGALNTSRDELLMAIQKDGNAELMKINYILERARDEKISDYREFNAITISMQDTCFSRLEPGAATCSGAGATIGTLLSGVFLGPLNQKKMLVKKKREIYRQKTMLWRQFKKEWYLLVCTEDEKYNEVRNKIENLKGQPASFVVSIVSGAIGHYMGVTAAILTPFVALLLHGAISLGLNTMCAVMKED